MPEIQTKTAKSHHVNQIMKMHKQLGLKPQNAIKVADTEVTTSTGEGIAIQLRTSVATKNKKVVAYVQPKKTGHRLEVLPGHEDTIPELLMSHRPLLSKTKGEFEHINILVRPDSELNNYLPQHFTQPTKGKYNTYKILLNTFNTREEEDETNKKLLESGRYPELLQKTKQLKERDAESFTNALPAAARAAKDGQALAAFIDAAHSNPQVWEAAAKALTQRARPAQTAAVHDLIHNGATQKEWTRFLQDKHDKERAMAIAHYSKESRVEPYVIARLGKTREIARIMKQIKKTGCDAEELLTELDNAKKISTYLKGLEEIEDYESNTQWMSFARKHGHEIPSKQVRQAAKLCSEIVFKRHHQESSGKG